MYSINVIHCLYLIIILKNKNTDDMKKLFLLLMGFISSLCIWADTTYTLTLNTSATQSTAGYFNVNSGGGFNTKYTGTYNGVSYTRGLKLNSSSSITFSNTGTATVVIVQSTSANGSNQFRFDGTVVTSTTGVDNPNTGDSNVREFTLTGVTAGTHNITNGTETGILYVSVTEASATSPTVKHMPLSATYALGTPSAAPLNVDVTMVDEDNDVLEYQWFSNTSNSVDGGVAITGATTRNYTPDISAVGTIYYYCVITEKDGDGAQVGNTAVTNTVAIEVISSVESPIFTEFNGTVQLDCATTSAVLYYSLDNGTTWIEYTHPFTVLDNDINVQAKAQVGGGTLTSEIATHNVVAVKKKAGSSSIVIYYDTTNMPRGANSAGEENAALIGKEGTEYQDWSIEITGTGKAISNGNAINGKSSIKNSNGRQMSIIMPAGVVANRITLYSYVNIAEATAKKNYWSEVAGTVYGENSIGMASFSDAANPDVRVYALDDIEDEITFNNNGVNQLAFYAVIDYTIDAGSVILNSEGLATYSSDKAVYVSGAQAYTCVLDDDNSTIDAQPIESNEIPALSGVLLYGEPGATVTLIQISSAADLGSNDLKPTTDITTPNNVAVLENNALALSGNVFKLYTGSAFVANKAYLVLKNASSGAKSYSLRFIAQEEEEVTAVEAPEAVETAETTGVKKAVKDGRLLIETATGVFTLSGARIK